MSMWDGLTTSNDTRILVLGATNRPNDIDSAILRRMPKRFSIKLPDSSQRKNILNLVRASCCLAEELVLTERDRRCSRTSSSTLRSRWTLSFDAPTGYQGVTSRRRAGTLRWYVALLHLPFRPADRLALRSLSATTCEVTKSTASSTSTRFKQAYVPLLLLSDPPLTPSRYHRTSRSDLSRSTTSSPATLKAAASPKPRPSIDLCCSQPPRRNALYSLYFAASLSPLHPSNHPSSNLSVENLSTALLLARSRSPKMARGSSSRIAISCAANVWAVVAWNPVGSPSKDVTMSSRGPAEA